MAHDVKKAANRNGRMWSFSRKWSSKEGSAAVFPAQKRQQAERENDEGHSDEDEENQSNEKTGGEDGEDEDEEEEGRDDLAALINVRRSRHAMTTEVYATLLEHRGIVIERQLSLPHEHPRFSSQEDALSEEDGLRLGQTQRSDSIEIRRTDSPHFSVRSVWDFPTSESSTLVGRRPRPFAQ